MVEPPPALGVEYRSARVGHIWGVYLGSQSIVQAGRVLGEERVRRVRDSGEGREGGERHRTGSGGREEEPQQQRGKVKGKGSEAGTAPEIEMRTAVAVADIEYEIVGAR